METDVRFKILVAGGPCEDFIEKCLCSILLQKEQNFEVLVSLDPYDRAPEIAKRYEGGRVKVWVNPKPKGSLFNVYCASCLSEMEDDDVLCFMDADDWLLDENSLSIVKSVYERWPETLVTHGGWMSNMGEAYDKTQTLKPYTEQEFEDIRKAPWRGTQLKTMRWRVFKNIKVSDFKDADGRWLMRAGDHALMFPALEMAGYHRTKCITKKIYLYNRKDRVVTPEGKIYPEADVEYVRAKQPYKLL